MKANYKILILAICIPSLVHLQSEPTSRTSRLVPPDLRIPTSATRGGFPTEDYPRTDIPSDLQFPSPVPRDTLPTEEYPRTDISRSHVEVLPTRPPEHRRAGVRRFRRPLRRRRPFTRRTIRPPPLDPYPRPYGLYRRPLRPERGRTRLYRREPYVRRPLYDPYYTDFRSYDRERFPGRRGDRTRGRYAPRFGRRRGYYPREGYGQGGPYRGGPSYSDERREPADNIDSTDRTIEFSRLGRFTRRGRDDLFPRRRQYLNARLRETGSLGRRRYPSDDPYGAETYDYVDRSFDSRSGSRHLDSKVPHDPTIPRSGRYRSSDQGLSSDTRPFSEVPPKLPPRRSQRRRSRRPRMFLKPDPIYERDVFTRSRAVFPRTRTYVERSRLVRSTPVPSTFPPLLKSGTQTKANTHITSVQDGFISKLVDDPVNAGPKATGGDSSANRLKSSTNDLSRSIDIPLSRNAPIKTSVNDTFKKTQTSPSVKRNDYLANSTSRDLFLQSSDNIIEHSTSAQNNEIPVTKVKQHFDILKSPQVTDVQSTLSNLKSKRKRKIGSANTFKKPSFLIDFPIPFAKFHSPTSRQMVVDLTKSSPEGENNGVADVYLREKTTRNQTNNIQETKVTKPVYNTFILNKSTSERPSRIQGHLSPETRNRSELLQAATIYRGGQFMRRQIRFPPNKQHSAPPGTLPKRIPAVTQSRRRHLPARRPYRDNPSAVESPLRRRQSAQRTDNDRLRLQESSLSSSERLSRHDLLFSRRREPQFQRNESSTLDTSEIPLRNERRRGGLYESRKQYVDESYVTSPERPLETQRSSKGHVPHDRLPEQRRQYKETNFKFAPVRPSEGNIPTDSIVKAQRQFEGHTRPKGPYRGEILVNSPPERPFQVHVSRDSLSQPRIPHTEETSIAPQEEHNINREHLPKPQRPYREKTTSAPHPEKLVEGHVLRCRVIQPISSTEKTTTTPLSDKAFDSQIRRHDLSKPQRTYREETSNTLSPERPFEDHVTRDRLSQPRRLHTEETSNAPPVEDKIPRDRLFKPRRPYREGTASAPYTEIRVDGHITRGRIYPPRRSVTIETSVTPPPDRSFDAHITQGPPSLPQRIHRLESSAPLLPERDHVPRRRLSQPRRQYREETSSVLPPERPFTGPVRRSRISQPLEETLVAPQYERPSRNELKQQRLSTERPPYTGTNELYVDQAPYRLHGGEVSRSQLLPSERPGDHPPRDLLTPLDRPYSNNTAHVPPMREPESVFPRRDRFQARRPYRNEPSGVRPPETLQTGRLIRRLVPRRPETHDRSGQPESYPTDEAPRRRVPLSRRQYADEPSIPATPQRTRYLPPTRTQYADETTYAPHPTRRSRGKVPRYRPPAPRRPQADKPSVKPPPERTPRRLPMSPRRPLADERSVSPPPEMTRLRVPPRRNIYARTHANETTYIPPPERRLRGEVPRRRRPGSQKSHIDEPSYNSPPERTRLRGPPRRNLYARTHNANETTYILPPERRLRAEAPRRRRPGSQRPHIDEPSVTSPPERTHSDGPLQPNLSTERISYEASYEPPRETIRGREHSRRRLLSPQRQYTNETFVPSLERSELPRRRLPPRRRYSSETSVLRPSAGRGLRRLPSHSRPINATRPYTVLGPERSAGREPQRRRRPPPGRPYPYETYTQKNHPPSSERRYRVTSVPIRRRRPIRDRPATREISTQPPRRRRLAPRPVYEHEFVSPGNQPSLFEETPSPPPATPRPHSVSSHDGPSRVHHTSSQSRLSHSDRSHTSDPETSDGTGHLRRHRSSPLEKYRTLSKSRPAPGGRRLTPERERPSLKYKPYVQTHRTPRVSPPAYVSTQDTLTVAGVRLGAVRARGGENGFPVHGGYCAGETCADGGLAAGVANGTGAGALDAYIERKRNGANEDIIAYKRQLGSPTVT